MPDQPTDSPATRSPDAAEEELADRMDDPVPSYGYRLTRVVGIGGSAGGIPAMQQFFGAMPASTGMAFVVILHLDPDHESSLDEILQKCTPMPVRQAVNGHKVEPDHVYVIPPGKHLSLTDGHLRLTELGRERGKRMTVDLFFRSLADTHGAHSVAIVMSGTDGDGALGVRRVKERGGLTIAQDPEEAEHPGMPRSAIGTSMVDWVLPAAKMPERVLAYDAREGRLELPPEVGPDPTGPRTTVSPEEAALRDVLAFLRARTGRDFSYYKRATIVRRLARRMQVNDVDNLPSYLDFLRVHPGEAGALLQDLLISVTNFFRDRDAFDALELQLPELFRRKTSADTVRVWVPACATGEEAYSIAMLLSEHAKTLDAPPSLQIFATDLDQTALADARTGLYPSAISADVSAERLQRFFIKEHRGYRIRRELREMLLFAPHDLLKDSPFSRVDLISCRNLLIYLNRDAQRRAFELFHFALNFEGRLFLGTSESADDSPHFYAVDKKYRIYGARLGSRSNLPLPSGPSTLARALVLQDIGNTGASLARKAQPTSLPSGPTGDGLDAERLSWRELHFNAIERYGSPSMIVNADDDILHSSRGMGALLQFAPGEPSANLYRAIHPSLRAELRAALFRATQTGKMAAVLGVPLELGDQRLLVDIRATDASELSEGLSFLAFEVRADGIRDRATLALDQDEQLAQHLEREVEQLKNNLRDIVDQHEGSTEELKASNEELQAINEELRSATEELETGREELQSMNEELTTVNYELKGKVDELGQANSHLHNLMGSTAIATVFLDHGLRVMRFTPSAVELFSLLPTDVGRPLAHLRHSLDYADLLVDAARVLETEQNFEREVAEANGRFFLARLVPYRAKDDHVAGVVLTFVDVTELHQARDALEQAGQALEFRVQQRTEEVDAMNGALRAEITLHERSKKGREELQRRLVDVQEQERSRISRELHDEVGQQISALMLALKTVEAEVPVGLEKLRDVRSIAEQIGREIHQLATQLRPVALDELGLSRALAEYLETWSARSGIPVDFFSGGLDEHRLPAQVEITVYRIVQEAMNNVYKHAAAKSVSVNVERRADHVLAIVEDDGHGFDLDAARAEEATHIGLSGMRERAAIAGGDLTIESSPRGGTTVRAQVPLVRG